MADGVQFEGEPLPDTDPMDAAAIRCWNLLATGHGGVDLSRIDLAMEWLGIADLDWLMHRLYLIRTHTRTTRPATQASSSAYAQD